jgi:hypothetical protein
MSMTDPYLFASRAPWPAPILRSSGAFPVVPALSGAQHGFWFPGGVRAMGENQYGISDMADTPKVHPEETPQGSAASINETKLFHDIVREGVRLPEDVLRVEFRFGEDSTGAPAVWIVFVAHDDLKPSKNKIASLQRAAEEVRSIVHSHSNRWPYIEIETE